jgi:predicted membrane protein
MASAPAQLPTVPPELVPERAGTVGFFGSQSRKGDWLLPRLFRAVSVLGNVELDLTRARVGPGTSRIEVMAVFGNVEVTVPPGFRVECDVSGMFNNSEVDARNQGPLSPDAPTISIGGTAFFANVEVKVVDPNAPGWIERLTARLSR